ncbi:hypothetical protein A3B21_04470 [Candidatus Uhrbacteria bacterium RIFCSPLOWO2_01_FULL_47_24]|uniref:Uncharacterized protein n=1 Tax=Candidatus Uhrbacteria bacterium RIFCSPLOWO2_01_FULL_47_24 TaxID=1802401 RepID=A0A1F7UVI7_9BACT|nr:MAG: hypothetical protein A2753_01120 [Candidatus Uhrbacteria bacterium RIFCSPHIGHO2_01_FULL_47_11]OGL81677.1 MAG: hypothetical protein A3B21_04470 [Candidatus Uhrbacteria bacterium RIFCSPLOWO2_01_FULL_47_24]
MFAKNNAHNSIIVPNPAALDKERMFPPARLTTRAALFFISPHPPLSLGERKTEGWVRDIKSGAPTFPTDADAIRFCGTGKLGGQVKPRAIIAPAKDRRLHFHLFIFLSSRPTCGGVPQ